MTTNLFLVLGEQDIDHLLHLYQDAVEKRTPLGMHCTKPIPLSLREYYTTDRLI